MKRHAVAESNTKTKGRARGAVVVLAVLALAVAGTGLAQGPKFGGKSFVPAPVMDGGSQGGFFVTPLGDSYIWAE